MTTIEKQIRDAVAALKPTVGPFFGVDAKAIIDELDRLRLCVSELEGALAETEALEMNHEGAVVRLTHEIEVQAAELDRLRARVAELEGARAEEVGRRTLRPLAEYHEDYGDVMWWEVPVEQPPVHVGSPLDDDFPNEDAAAFGWHFTRFMNPLEKAEAAELLDHAPTVQAEPQTKPCAGAEFVAAAQAAIQPRTDEEIREALDMYDKLLGAPR